MFRALQATFARFGRSMGRALRAQLVVEVPDEIETCEFFCRYRGARWASG